jgi:NAD dependent epimerase/dehydratase family
MHPRASPLSRQADGLPLQLGCLRPNPLTWKWELDERIGWPACARTICSEISTAHVPFEVMLRASAWAWSTRIQALFTSTFGPLMTPTVRLPVQADELISHTYFNVHGMSLTGLRFFTVYGPWGRPDMAAYKFAKSIVKGEPIAIFQAPDKSELSRDFTYIDDVVDGIISALLTAPPSVKGLARFRCGGCVCCAWWGGGYRMCTWMGVLCVGGWGAGIICARGWVCRGAQAAR